MARTRTPAALILGLVLLATPLAATPLERAPLSFTSLLSSLWEVLAAPLSGAVEKTGTGDGGMEGSRQGIDPNGATTSLEPTEGDTTERRLGIDPNG